MERYDNVSIKQKIEKRQTFFISSSDEPLATPRIL